MSTGRLWDVVVVGDLFLDLVMTGFARLPAIGEELLATSLRREAGGGAAHTSCGLAVLGARTRVLGVVGAEESDWFRSRLESKGVDAKALISHRSETTAITVAISTSHDRVFYTYPGANRLLPQLLRSSEFRSQLGEARHVHIAHLIEPTCLENLADALHRQNTTLSVDVGWDESWLDNPASLSALKKVDWFLPNEREAERLTGESDPDRILKWFERQGLTGVVLKLGPRGAEAQFRGVRFEQPALEVQPIDTTGAGDCFDAGFLFAWLSGIGISESLAWGNVCGGLSTRCAGGIEGFPSRAEVENALAQKQEKA